jgi:hypothetical protein
MGKIIISLIAGLSILVLFCGCPEKQWDGEIIIENISNDTIIYAFYFQEYELENTKEIYWGNNYNTSKKIISPNSYGIHEFNMGVGPNKYYLFNLDSVRTIPWERIRDERIILKEVIFNSWEEMEACNFTITYP